MSPVAAMRRVLAPLVCAITFLMPIAVWVASTGQIGEYFTREVPPGQTLFVFSKLFALLAITMFWFQAMSALAQSSPALAGFPRLAGRLHALFGMATFAAVVLHLLLFIVASTLRTRHAALDLLVPAVGQGFYRTMISLGAIAFWMLLVALIAGWLRFRAGRPLRRWIHRLVFGVFALGFLHGVTIGSETRYGLMTYVYAFMGLSLGTVLLSRACEMMRRRRRAVAVGVALPRTVDGSRARAE